MGVDVDVDVDVMCGRVSDGLIVVVPAVLIFAWLSHAQKSGRSKVFIIENPIGTFPQNESRLSLALPTPTPASRNLTWELGRASSKERSHDYNNNKK